MQADNKRENQTLKEIFKTYLLPQKWSIVIITVLILFGVLLGNVSPFLYGKMVDAINATDTSLLIKLIVIYCAATLGALGLSLLEKYFGEIVSFKIVNNIKNKLFNKIITAKCKDYSRFTTGEYISRLNGDSESIISFFLDLITNFGQVIINLGISIAFIVSISMRLSTVALFYLPASFLVSFMARKYYKKLAEEQRKLDDKHYSFITEVFSNQTGVKSFQMEGSVIAKYKNIIASKLKLVKRSLRLGNTVNVFSSLVMLVSSMYIIYISALLIKGGALTLGTMISFNTYINIMFSSVSKVWSFNISKQSVMVAAGRISDILDTEGEYENDAGKKIKADALPCLRVRDLKFTYPETETPILESLSFSIDAYGIYSFVGKNGCGKSTLAKLLVRFYDAEAGGLNAWGNEYKQYTLESLRENITYIQKDDFFLKDTILNNLKLAKENASQEEIYDACRQADIHGFITALPDKYETIIGESGSTLSSGQKQKLSIARALLRNSKILILDEITANLDGKAEKDVLSVLLKLRHDTIILLISHKASSIVSSDCIFVMENGKIVASGSHEKLSRESKLYSELFCEITRG